MTQETNAYLNEVLDYIQQYSVMRENVDWTALRRDALTLANDAQTTAKTYSAIKLALERLGDHHSFFRDPEAVRLHREGSMKQVGLLAVYSEGIVGFVFPGSSAEQAGVQVGDRIETINGLPIATLDNKQFQDALEDSYLSLTLKRAEQLLAVTLHATQYPFNLKPEGRLLKHSIGYLELSRLLGSPKLAKPYATLAQQIIREIDQTIPCGWIIDLRRNDGGNMWPMLAGAGPILGEGELGSFVSPDGNRQRWYYHNGQALLEKLALAQVDEPYQLNRPLSPVAVLTSQLTASSGELTVLAFRGRPRVRIFGEPTSGVPTANEGKALSDGAMVLLTIALGADRTGRIYDGSIIPDQYIKIDWTLLGTEHDPVLKAAIEWLHRQEGCL